MDAQAGRPRVDNSARLLELKRLRTDGAARLASKRRGRTSNNKVPAAVRELTMTLVKSRYADFGPTRGKKSSDRKRCGQKRSRFTKPDGREALLRLAYDQIAVS